MTRYIHRSRFIGSMDMYIYILVDIFKTSIQKDWSHYHFHQQCLSTYTILSTFQIFNPSFFHVYLSESTYIPTFIYIWIYIFIYMQFLFPHFYKEWKSIAIFRYLDFLFPFYTSCSFYFWGHLVKRNSKASWRKWKWRVKKLA